MAVKKTLGIISPKINTLVSLGCHAICDQFLPAFRSVVLTLHDEWDYSATFGCYTVRIGHAKANLFKDLG